MPVITHIPTDIALDRAIQGRACFGGEHTLDATADGGMIISKVRHRYPSGHTPQPEPVCRVMPDGRFVPDHAVGFGPGRAFEVQYLHWRLAELNAKLDGSPTLQLDVDDIWAQSYCPDDGEPCLKSCAMRSNCTDQSMKRSY